MDKHVHSLWSVSDRVVEETRSTAETDDKNEALTFHQQMQMQLPQKEISQ